LLPKGTFALHIAEINPPALEGWVGDSIAAAMKGSQMAAAGFLQSLLHRAK
jgi:hypothetical protein